MAVTYLNNGAKSVADANWEDGEGFGRTATDPQLIIQDATQAITDNLDQSGATNAVDYLWIIGGAPRIRASDGSSLKIKPDATYTTDPNFIWKTLAGNISIEFVTNACTLAIVDGGGEVTFTGGTITTLVVRSGKVIIGAGCTVVNLIVVGGDVTIVAGTAMTTFRLAGGRVDSDRLAVTCHIASGLFVLDNTTGTGMTLMNQLGGSFVPVAGDVATYNWQRGSIERGSAERKIDLGTTAFTNYSPSSIPGDTTFVTFSNKVDYAVTSSGPGGGV